jgi:pyridoxal phosphate enzyme (YggS family)
VANIGMTNLEIQENLQEVEENIKKACERIGRNDKDVLLVAVSKTKPIELLQDVYQQGIRDFGENYVQELTEKIDTMPKDIKWHMIGHLQRNKVKYIVGNVFMIHSVDSFRLAEEISKEAVKKNTTVQILIEVNVAGEENKYGVSPEQTEGLIRQIAGLKNIIVKGLMTSAPYVENPEENRKYFKQLRQLCVDINAKNIDNISMDTLSMGMTNDYVVAIEEGSTMVRVGTAIFGARNYNK